jgi:Domain of unknown function (DUF932)
VTLGATPRTVAVSLALDDRLLPYSSGRTLEKVWHNDFFCYFISHHLSGLFRLVCTNGMVVSDGTFQRISIKHSGFNPDSVIEASFKVLNAVPDIMNKVQLFQDRVLTDAERLALATGAAAYRWEDLTKAQVSPSLLLNPRRYGDGAKDLWTTLNCVQENIIRGGQRDRSRRRPDGNRMPKSRAIKGIDEDMKLNKALWEMAEVLRNRGAE